MKRPENMTNTDDCTCTQCGWEGIFGWTHKDIDGEQAACPECGCMVLINE